MSKSEEISHRDLEAVEVVSDSEMAQLNSRSGPTKSCRQLCSWHLCAFWLLSVVVAVILAVIIVFTKTNDLQNQINDLKAQMAVVQAQALAGLGDSVVVLGFSSSCPLGTQYTSTAVGQSMSLSCFSQPTWTSALSSSSSAQLPFTVPEVGLYHIIITGPFSLSSSVNVTTDRAVEVYVQVGSSRQLFTASNEQDLSLEAFLPLKVGDVVSVVATYQFVGTISYGVDQQPLSFSLVHAGVVN